MSVSGLCEVCQAADVVARCDRCGAMVCEEHHDRGSGLCLSCARQAGVGDDRSGDGADRPDGGDVYR